MIKHYVIGQPISTVGGKLQLEGLEMYIKGDTTYLETKGWVDLKTRQQVLDNYSCSNHPGSILIPILSERTKPSTNPSYEQMLMDKVAATTFDTLMTHKDYGDEPTKELVMYAYEHANEFIKERKKYLL